MKITVDTATDSKEDIRRAIELLKGYLGGGVPERKEFDMGSEGGSMFGALEGSGAPKDVDMFGNEIRKSEEEPERKKGIFNIEIVDDF